MKEREELVMGSGPFDRMFDFNRDGKLDVFERASQFMILEQMMSDEDTEESNDLDSWDDEGLDSGDYDL